jgi:hypothetical protein
MAQEAIALFYASFLPKRGLALMNKWQPRAKLGDKTFKLQEKNSILSLLLFLIAWAKYFLCHLSLNK